MVLPLWRTVGHFLKMLNTELQYDINSVPRDTPRKMKTYVHTKACTQIGKVEKNANVHQQMRMDK